MEKIYKFRRDFYQEVLDATNKTNVTFLLGPRKCGKTVCLKQLNNEITDSRYVNFKNLNSDESMDMFDEIADDIQNDRRIVYLLDEITYAHRPDNEISRIADILTVCDNENTKIVFTGSQSVALESWGNKYFCGNAKFVRTDFLTYNEWLGYKHYNAPTAENYREFLYTVSDFYRFVSLEDYLRGCLEETITSNYNATSYIFGNDVDSVDVQALIDICYATLFTLHNHVGSVTFAKNRKLEDDISYYFRNVCKQFEPGELGRRIEQSFISRYNDFKSKDLRTLKQSFNFLNRCGLITITPVVEELDAIININKDLLSYDSVINVKEDLFRKYNVCIKYPMFYMEILKDILKECMPEQLPGQLLGSIVECHARGILPSVNSVEYHDETGKEIDYINRNDRTAIEITVSNKSAGMLNFDVLNNEYQKVSLTRDRLRISSDIFEIPYYKMLAVGYDSLMRLKEKLPDKSKSDEKLVNRDGYI